MRMLLPFVRAAGVVVAAFVLAATPTLARSVTDSAGRTVEVPDTVRRVFAAGPPAAVLLYALAPQALAGWVRAPTDDAKQLLLPALRELPETGRLTGRGDALNLERLVATRPDLVVDFGTVNDSYRALADRVPAQTGIPYLLIDGGLNNTPAALRLLAGILGVEPRGEALARAAEGILAEADRMIAATPVGRRPRVYLARGPDGLKTASRAPMIDRVGAVNVAATLPSSQGNVSTTPAQLADLAPDAIVTVDPEFRRSVADKPEWKAVPAVAAGRVFLAPSLPFGFVDDPPSLNRLIGLTWLLHALYPAQQAGDIREPTRAFFHLFYQVDLDERQLDRLLDNSGH